MKRLLRSTFPLLLIVTGMMMQFQGCKPDPKPQRYLGDYPLGEIKDYLYFQPGSQWVYECDSTLELDTQVMVQCDTPWFEKSFITYQLLTFRKRSISQNINYDVFYPSTDVLYRDDFDYFFSTAIKSSKGGVDNIFFHPFDPNSTGGGGSSETFYRDYQDSMQVLGKWYKDIRIFEVKLGSTWPRISIETWEGARQTIYWSKHIGVVKINVVTAKSGQQKDFIFNWNLKSHQVLQ